MMKELEKRKARHADFWERKNSTPLIGYSPGNYFVSCRYEAAKPLLESKDEILPRMINPKVFLPDYERIYWEIKMNGGDLFYTPEPFTGLPWLEAISGMPVFSASSSFIAERPETFSPGKIVNAEWLDKYIEFCDLLVSQSHGRFVCGQPILRGPADLLGSAIGQQQLIFDMVDYPEEIKKQLNAYADLLAGVLEKTRKCADRILGGTAMGFYHLWCPGESLWFQDDLTSLMSPKLYEDLLLDVHKRLSQLVEYTMIHLHMSSAYLVDYLLEMDGLKAIQLNKDIGGPSVEMMLPLMKKILEAKNLVLWGNFTQGELNFLQNNLNPQGLYIIVHGDSLITNQGV